MKTIVPQKSDFTFLIWFMFLFGILYSCNSINTKSRSIPNVCDRINQPTKESIKSIVFPRSCNPTAELRVSNLPIMLHSILFKINLQNTLMNKCLISQEIFVVASVSYYTFQFYQPTHKSVLKCEKKLKKRKTQSVKG